MSTGEKKPGLRDLSELKSRLGMAKPAAAPQAPEAPAAPGVVDLAQSPDLELGADTAIVRIDKLPRPQPAAPAPVAATPVAPAPPPPAPVAAPVAAPKPKPAFNLEPLGAPAPRAPAPPPSSGFSLGSADELFGKKEPPARPAVSAPAAPQQAPANLEAAFASPAAEPPKGEAKFAHPLQVGRFVQASESVDLSADEEKVLNSFEGKQRGIKTSFALAITVVVALLTLFVGFALGDALVKRRMINAQIDASAKTRDLIQPVLDKYRELAPLIAALSLSPDKVDWDKIELIAEDLPDVDAGVLLSTPIPLDRELTKVLNDAVADISLLFKLTREHRELTLGRDKADLKALESGSSFEQGQAFAILYEPRDPKTEPLAYIPPEGEVVAILGKWKLNAEGTENVIPVRKRSKEEAKEVSLRNLIVIQKDQLMAGGSENAQTNYTKRLGQMVRLAKRINQYEPNLRELLNREATRAKVASL